MPPKKEEKKVDHFVEFGFVGLIILFLWMLWSVILDYLLKSRFGSYASIWQVIKAWLAQYVWPIVVVLCVIVTVLSIVALVMNYRKLKKLNEEESKIYGSEKRGKDAEEPANAKNERWEHVIEHINSPSAGDWRLAIIEADVMLDELLRAQGYHGDSLGEMLKGVEKSDFLTLDAAWEAHKIRNQIAHSGSDYLLNERDAKHVISLYESVFREFKII
ncbi:hypothetical protein KW796_01695 [Candidatus Parcubacteria bacterium]|nr:hypothetical protein [Candidatus Parcubacteria bacterium]